MAPTVLITGCSSGIGHATRGAAREVRPLDRVRVRPERRPARRAAGARLPRARTHVTVAATAVGSVAAADDGPYADFNAAVARATSARLLTGLRRVLPDRAWDRVIGRPYGA